MFEVDLVYKMHVDYSDVFDNELELIYENHYNKTAKMFKSHKVEVRQYEPFEFMCYVIEYRIKGIMKIRYWLALKLLRKIKRW